MLLVISWHVADGAFAAIHGSNGVIVFFVLSGFLITTLGLREERRDKFRYVPFLVRRAFRILPLLYLGVAIYAVAIFALHLDSRDTEYVDAIPWIIGYLPEVPVLSAPATAAGMPGPVPFSGVWSLGIEEKFYVIWPVIAFIALGSRPRYRGTTAATLCIGLWLLPFFVPNEIARFSSPYAPLLLGCALACALQQPGGHAFLVRLTHPAFACASVVSAVAFTTLDLGHLNTIGFQLSAVIMLTFVILRPGSRPARLLSTRPAVLIGTLSYALYLFHSFGLKTAEQILGENTSIGFACAQMFLGVALSLPACYLMHVAIERPMQQLGRRITSRNLRHLQPSDTNRADKITANGTPIQGAGEFRR